MIPHDPSLLSRARLSIMEVIPFVKEDATDMVCRVGGDDLRVEMSSNRLRCLARSQVCVSCGRRGTTFSIDAPRDVTSGGPKNSYDRPHLNLYSDDGVLMTVDHITPKAAGGGNGMANLQTMCAICNSKKGDGMDGHGGEFYGRDIKIIKVEGTPCDGIWMRPDLIPITGIDLDTIVPMMAGVGRHKFIIEMPGDWFYISPKGVSQFAVDRTCSLCGRMAARAIIVSEKGGDARPEFVVASEDGVLMRMVPVDGTLAGGKMEKMVVCDRCRPTPMTERFISET